MTYGQARLWLGVVGVGSLVTGAAVVLATSSPTAILTTSASFGLTELVQLLAAIGLFVAWLTPFDFVGGYLLPAKFGNARQTFGAWAKGYCIAAFSQAVFFLLFGSIIILLSQRFGGFGSFSAVSLGVLVCATIRNRTVLARRFKSPTADRKILDAIVLIQSWETFVSKTIVVDHEDDGFTGGIVGFGERSKIIIPSGWLSFTKEQLATAIARRSVAINSGSYTRGVVIAYCWNVVGFMLCSIVLNADLTTVAGLVTNVCGFTLWSFLGLLILPIVSRNASIEIDRELVRQGMPAGYLSAADSAMWQSQDFETARGQWNESISHPASDIDNRVQPRRFGRVAAWNAARTTLFFSWACLGVLSRSVHCNVGRPELWTMLPTD